MGRRDAASGLLGASGHIVNVSSVASHFVWPGATAYTAARWAVRGFTEALRADLTGMRPMCYVTLTIDRRVLDGFQANAHS